MLKASSLAKESRVSNYASYAELLLPSSISLAPGPARLQSLAAGLSSAHSLPSLSAGAPPLALPRVRRAAKLA